jgi:hypothetical protein
MSAEEARGEIKYPCYEEVGGERLMKNANRLAVCVILVAVLAGATFVVAVGTSQKLRPVGRIRVSLEGTARWNGFVQVHDGSFSAELFADGTHSASVIVSPLNIYLRTLRASDVVFWAYYYSTIEVYPMIDFVLDNGRRMEGSAFSAKSSTTPVSGTVTCEDGSSATPSQTCLGYPTADIWIKMKAQDAWYSSYAGIDTAIPTEFGIDTPKTIAQWAALPGFGDARIVQMMIAYRAPSSPSIVDIEVYIDDITIRGMLIRVEPESTADVPSGIP